MSAATRIALLAVHPRSDPASPTYKLPNYGVRRIEAAAKAHLGATAEVRVFESHVAEPNGLLRELSEFDADLVGLSAYLWSLPTLIEVGRAFKREHPERTLVVGGPSARPAMFQVPPFDDAHRFIDALVIEEPELAFCEVARCVAEGGARFDGIAGLELPQRRVGILGQGRWTPTTKRVPPPRLQARITSPYQAGLIEPGGLACLQTYYGCPFSCSFCSWGAMGDADDVLDVDYIARELQAMKDNDVEGALLVDAALNLNAHAFRNLRDAEARVGLFEDTLLHCEVYPAKLTDQHLRFIESIRRPSLAVGVQSFDEEVLARLQRRFDAARFERVVQELSTVSDVVIEIIAGLPGDRPESFIETFERALATGCSVRVYPCLVLPDGFMTRAPEHFALDWDPVSLKLRSSWGWTPEGMARVQEYVVARAAERGGQIGEYWWSFDSFGMGPSPGVGTDGKPIAAALHARIMRWSARATDGRWQLTGARRDTRRVLLEFDVGSARVALSIGRKTPGEERFAEAAGLAFWVIGELPHAEEARARRLVPILAKLLSARPAAPAPLSSGAS